MENGLHSPQVNEDLENGDDGERERRSGSFSSYTWETQTCFEDQGQNNDLILAAKLGKSLLEQNEELTAEYYKIVRKLEVCTLDFCHNVISCLVLISFDILTFTDCNSGEL